MNVDLYSINRVLSGFKKFNGFKIETCTKNTELCVNQLKIYGIDYY